METPRESAAAKPPTVVGPLIEVRPFDARQVYETGASGYTWYRWTFDPNRADNVEQALDWLFADLDLGYVRNAFDQALVSANTVPATATRPASRPTTGPASARYDIGKPDDIEVTPTGQGWPAPSFAIESYQFERPDSRNMWVYNRAKLRNPRTRLMTYAHLFPPAFRKPNGNKRWAGWPVDHELPYVDDYLAKWMFANLLNLRLNEGADVDVLDVYNEPDEIRFGAPPDAPADAPPDARDALQRDAVAHLLHAVIPKLRAWVADPRRNRWGVKMPLVMAPSTLGPRTAARWLQFWHDHADDPAYAYRDAWANIDVVSVHQYYGGYDPGPYAAINRIRGDRAFMQSEMHLGDDVLKQCPLPDPAMEDQLQAALLLGRFFANAVNNGVSVYDYYMGVSALEKPESLLRYEGRKFTRRKVYFAYRQLTRTQPRGSRVVASSLSGLPDGFDAVAFRHGDDDVIYVNVVNRTANACALTLRLLDAEGRLLTVASVAATETSAARDDEPVDGAAAPAAAANAAADWTVDSPAHGIRCFAVRFRRR
jgi:hypothetical protein